MKLTVTSIPEQLYQFFATQIEEAIEFRKNIRSYNNIFSLTSFGASLDKDLASLRQGIYTFRVHEQIYHDLPTLVLEENNQCYFQLYFYDTGNELQNRMRTQYNKNLSAKVVEKLMKILKQNPYAQVLRRLEDIFF